MSITKSRIRFITMLIALCISIPLFIPVSGAAYTPPFQTLRIGLYYGTNALTSANLQNVSGLGSGYEFGYFDADRNFVSIGAGTDESRISMLMDRNMVWNPGDGDNAGEYREGTKGDIVVGCFHIQLNSGYDTYAEAKAEANRYKNSFVRYESERFLALVGRYTTRNAANEALSSLGLSEATVNAGTSKTIAVTKTGTNTILFEFDMDATPLGIMPKASNGKKSETWFKGLRYNGGFIYSRRDGELITVANMVDIEDYVKGILPNEMNNAWPMEALKAQACCARTYALATVNRHNSSNGFDLCVTEHCQVYRGRVLTNERTDQAVEETLGMYITYENKLCETYYASSNGGASENVENVWNVPLPYLRGVIDPYEADISSTVPKYRWTLTYTQSQITERLRGRGYNCAKIVSMVATQLTPTGNVLTLVMTDSNGKKWQFSKRSEIMTALGVPTMRFSIGGGEVEPGSIYFGNPPEPVSPGSRIYMIGKDGVTTAVSVDSIFAINSDTSVTPVEGEDETANSTASTTGLVDGVFTIRGTGNGHQVGMSQWGAYSMALYHNKTYVDIINFYFTGVDIG